MLQVVMLAPHTLLMSCLRVVRGAVIASLCLLCLLAGFHSGGQFLSVSLELYRDAGLKPCPPPQHIPDLGPVPIHLKLLTSRSRLITDNVRNHVTRGGQWKPSHCRAGHRVAILVPYRDREDHLYVFLQHIHQFLQKQLVHYGIYIIEQADAGPFNRARLLNVGFLEATKDSTWDCVIFHDVDLLPTNSRNLYYCSEQPRHYSVSVNTLGSKLLYEGQFGGVSGMLVDQFWQVNGFSNMYWGWGGEDDDMATRLDVQGLSRVRYPPHIGSYIMQSHPKDTKDDREKWKLLNTALYRIPHDGLPDTRYTLIHTNRTALYTKYIVSLTKDLEEMMLYMKHLKIPHVRWRPMDKMGAAQYQTINW